MWSVGRDKRSLGGGVTQRAGRVSVHAPDSDHHSSSLPLVTAADDDDMQSALATALVSLPVSLSVRTQ